MSNVNPFNIPASRTEVSDRQKTDVKSNLAGSDPFLKNSFMGALITGFSGRIYDVYQQVLILIQQIFPNTATGVNLDRWAFLKNITLNVATQANGLIAVTGVPGSFIPSGTNLTSSTGAVYQTSVDETIASYVINLSSLTFNGGVATAATSSNHNLATGMNVTIAGANPSDYNGLQNITVVDALTFTYSIATSPISPATGTIVAQTNYVATPVLSQAFGANQNLNSGTALSFTTPLSGVDNAAYVLYSQIGGGSDIESDNSYRARIIYAYQNPVSFFNISQLTQLVQSVAGVTRVFINPITPAVGQVTVYFMRDNDINPIPTSSEVNDVKNKLLTVLPAHMSASDLIVSSPTPLSVNFSFSSISPNTPSMKSAITANLAAFFQEETQVGVNLLANQYNSIIFRTIDPQTGMPLNGFALTSPTGDVAVSASQIPVLGSVTFP